jgi:hypothetical protein
MNQAVFERIEISDGGVTKLELSGPFKVLLQHDFVVKAEAAKRPAQEPSEPASAYQLHREEWADGVPVWLRQFCREQIKTTQPGARSLRTPGRCLAGAARSVSLGLGLNEHYLAGEVGFKPTRTPWGSPRCLGGTRIRSLCHPPAGESQQETASRNFCPRPSVGSGDLSRGLAGSQVCQVTHHHGKPCAWGGGKPGLP